MSVHIRSVAPPRPLSYLGFAPNDVQGSAGSRLPAGVDLTQPPPHPFMNEALFVCADIEGNCMTGNTSELGFTIFDVRDVHPELKKDETLRDPSARPTPPGPQGRNWLRLCKSYHWRVVEEPHENCNRFWHKQHPRNFAFGTTKFLHADQIRRKIDDFYHNLEHRNLTPTEQQQGKKRYIILVAWASRMEETTLAPLRTWYHVADRAWDSQKMDFARTLGSNLGKNPPVPKIEELVEATGIYTHNNCADFGNNQLLHNGGNDSAFELQGMLVGLLSTPDEFAQAGIAAPPVFPRTWRVDCVRQNQLRAPPSSS